MKEKLNLDTQGERSNFWNSSTCVHGEAYTVVEKFQHVGRDSWSYS